MAREAGMDLVEVAPTARPPVCRIMDYGKWRYQQQKKEDKSRASSRAGQLKELKLRTVKIGDHDLMIKINHAREFLKEGNKVQFTLQFKGREMAHLELGRALFIKIKQEHQGYAVLGSQFAPVDYAHVATGFGFQAARVDSEATLQLAHPDASDAGAEPADLRLSCELV